MHGASWATRLQTYCLQRRRAKNHRLIIWRVTELHGTQWRRRRRRCREEGVPVDSGRGFSLCAQVADLIRSRMGVSHKVRIGGLFLDYSFLRT